MCDRSLCLVTAVQVRSLACVRSYTATVALSYKLLGRGTMPLRSILNVAILCFVQQESAMCRLLSAFNR